ncbi:MAG TPA: sensor histidine kinase [Acidimicrobiales bacterium]
MNLIGRIERRANLADPWLVDGLMAALFTVAALLTVFGEDIVDGLREPNGFAALGAVVCSVPIAFRRRVPLTALVVACAACAVHIGFNFPEGSIPTGILLLLYSVAAWSTTRRAVVGLVCVAVSLATIVVFSTPGLGPGPLFSSSAVFGIAFAMGIAMRSRRESGAAQLQAANERADLEAQRSATAVAEERLRIAQELHDVVAHSMSVIAVQAGVGSHLLDEQPERARAALDAISDTSRSTLAEMRRLLGVLRDSDGARQNAPAPTLAELPQLVDDVRAAGVPVTLEVDGARDHIDRGIELSAYRVVQEALTNVIKHAGSPTTVRVCLQHRPGRLAIEVSDDGRGLASNGTGAESGHGLIGMRERVEVWGGQLSAGPRPGGGYLVRASLPYGEEP